MIRKMTGALALAAIIACFVTACNSVPVTDQEKSLFGDEVGSAIQRFHNIDPFIGRQMDSAWGYAVFPSVGRGGVGLGGAYGAGEGYENGVHHDVGFHLLLYLLEAADVVGVLLQQLGELPAPQAFIQRFAELLPDGAEATRFRLGGIVR